MDLNATRELCLCSLSVQEREILPGDHFILNAMGHPLITEEHQQHYQLCAGFNQFVLITPREG